MGMKEQDLLWEIREHVLTEAEQCYKHPIRHDALGYAQGLKV